LLLLVLLLLLPRISAVSVMLNHVCDVGMVCLPATRKELAGGLFVADQSAVMMHIHMLPCACFVICTSARADTHVSATPTVAAVPNIQHHAAAAPAVAAAAAAACKPGTGGLNCDICPAGQWGPGGLATKPTSLCRNCLPGKWSAAGAASEAACNITVGEPPLLHSVSAQIPDTT
jgi:hypothetical protein